MAGGAQDRGPGRGVGGPGQPVTILPKPWESLQGRQEVARPPSWDSKGEEPWWFGLRELLSEGRLHLGTGGRQGSRVEGERGRVKASWSRCSPFVHPRATTPREQSRAAASLPAAAHFVGENFFGSSTRHRGREMSFQLSQVGRAHQQILGKKWKSVPQNFRKPESPSGQGGQTALRALAPAVTARHRHRRKVTDTRWGLGVQDQVRAGPSAQRPAPGCRWPPALSVSVPLHTPPWSLFLWDILLTTLPELSHLLRLFSLDAVAFRGAAR